MADDPREEIIEDLGAMVDDLQDIINDVALDRDEDYEAIELLEKAKKSIDLALGALGH